LWCAGARAEEFALRTVEWAPFSTVAVWAPEEGTPGKFETVVLLHGNQGSPPDAAWMVDLRWQRQFARRILIVPALDGYDWGSAANAKALAALVAELAKRLPIDLKSTVLVGYSAGASRVVQVARHLKVRGVVSVAGDVLRGTRGVADTLGVLLVCMTGDRGPHTSCGLAERNLEKMGKLGVHDRALRRLPGDHRLDLAALAPVLDEWLRSHR
jgi:pimeloyl-ACP methyl ester carboxylesterase